MSHLSCRLDFDAMAVIPPFMGKKHCWVVDDSPWWCLGMQNAVLGMDVDTLHA
jgi:hypothetical protein